MPELGTQSSTSYSLAASSKDDNDSTKDDIACKSTLKSLTIDNP